MQHGRDDALSTESLPELESEIARLEQDRTQCEKRIRELREAEDPATNTFFAREIFQLQQDKLRLGVELDLRRKKINRIRYQHSLWQG